jgi:hypothetical protein
LFQATGRHRYGLHGRGHPSHGVTKKIFTCGDLNSEVIG